MQIPKVSVLMPIYKPCEEHLRAAIESILNQTYSDFELLLLDDCPEDTREAVVRSYSDPRIRYEKNDRNLGITPSRNKLIDMARGEYLAVCDHDDVSLPERFAHEVAYLEEHPECGVVSGWSRVMGSDVIGRNPEQDDEIRYELVKGYVVCHPAAMLRKSALTENNIRYEEYYSPAEDYSLWCRLIPVTKFHNLQEVVLDYRVHDRCTTKVQSEKMHVAHQRVRALNEICNPVLFREMELREQRECFVRVLGLPLFSVTVRESAIRMRLFGIPIVKIKFW